MEQPKAMSEAEAPLVESVVSFGPAMIPASSPEKDDPSAEREPEPPSS